MHAPADIRENIERSLQTIAEALDRVQRAPMISRDDRARLEKLKATVLEKQDGLAGLNGFHLVPDSQLSAFVDNVVQDMERADRTITVRLVSALLLLNATVVITAVLSLLTAFGVLDGSLASMLSAN